MNDDKIMFTKEGAESAIQQLAELGYEILPCDDPGRASKGYLCFKQDNGDEKIIEYPVFEKFLKLEVGPDFTDVDDLLHFARSSDGKYDEPIKLRLGFIKYFPKNGTSYYRGVSLNKLKNFNWTREKSEELARIHQSNDGNLT